MANTLLTIAMITREASMVLENNLTFTKQVRRDYDDRFGVAGAKIGTVLNVRLPVQYVYAQGQGLQLQDVTETSVPLALTTQYQRSFIFSSSDLALSIDDFSSRFVKPAVANLANQVDGDGLALYKQIYQLVGTPGAVPTDLLTYLNSRTALTNSACPMDDELALVINPNMEANIVNTLKGLFQDSKDIAAQYRDGKMGRTIGYKWSMDQNVGTQTIGAWTGSTPTVTTAPANGATSIVTGGWAHSTAVLNAGDLVYFASVNSVNPQSRANNNALQGFTVLTNVTSDGSGNATLQVSPVFNATGAAQNITAMPAANAVITVYGASSQVTPQGLAFHREAFCFANADLEMPNGVDMKDRIAPKKLNISIRLVRAYDINTDRFPLRLDLLGGWAVLRPQLACRIAS